MNYTDNADNKDNTDNIDNNPKKIEEYILSMGRDVEVNIPIEILQEKYSFLYEKYPHLFDLVAKGKGKRLEYIPMIKNMLYRLTDIQSGKISKDKANEKIGLDLAKKYIYSKIDMEKEISGFN